MPRAGGFRCWTLVSRCASSLAKGGTPDVWAGSAILTNFPTWRTISVLPASEYQSRRVSASFDRVSLGTDPNPPARPKNSPLISSKADSIPNHSSRNHRTNAMPSRPTTGHPQTPAQACCISRQSTEPRPGPSCSPQNTCRDDTTHLLSTTYVSHALNVRTNSNAPARSDVQGPQVKTNLPFRPKPLTPHTRHAGRAKAREVKQPGLNGRALCPFRQRPGHSMSDHAVA
ncbi:hypothetical protein LX90_009093 [Lentzea flava]|nr:hypothetical protein [Lentzea flava]